MKNESMAVPLGCWCLGSFACEKLESLPHGLRQLGFPAICISMSTYCIFEGAKVCCELLHYRRSTIGDSTHEYSFCTLLYCSCNECHYWLHAIVEDIAPHRFGLV